MKKKKKIVNQLIHKGCPNVMGEIMVVLDGDEVKFVCGSCRYLWELPQMFRMGMPKQWEAVRPSSEDVKPLINK